MSKFNPEHLGLDAGLDAPDTGDSTGLLGWLADYVSDSDSTPSAEAADGVSPAHSLGLDGEFFSVWLSGDGGFDGPGDDPGAGLESSSLDFGAAVSSVLSDSPTWAEQGDIHSEPATSDVQGIFTADSGNGVTPSLSVDDIAGQPDPVSAGGGNGEGMLTGQDLTFLDTTPFAKGGNSGNSSNGGGGGGHGGSTGGDPNVLSTYISGDPNVSDANEYNIEIDFKGTWTADLQKAFIDSADAISHLITGDIADVFYRGQVIDDIKITAELSDIDGPGGVLGQAGPTAVRTADYLPATATMQFDSADANVFNGIDNVLDIDGKTANADGSPDKDMLWDVIVLHEMLHSIGFGTIWSYKGLIADAGTDHPTFIGAAAENVYGGAVPVEGSYGAGTNDSHWDEATFGSEIMTGFIGTADDPTHNYLSDLTVASLHDLGYQTQLIG